MELWLIVIIVIMGASFVHSVLVLSGIVRPRRDGFDEVLEYLKAENQELKNIAAKQTEQIKELTEQVNQLRQESMMLRTQIVLFESAQFDLPYPNWMFDFQGNLVSANKAFEDTFLVPNGKTITDVMGALTSDIMDDQAAKEYLKNHRWVLSQKRPWEGAIAVQLNGKADALNIVLYPAFSGKQIIGVAGLLIPSRRIENF